MKLLLEMNENLLTTTTDPKGYFIEGVFLMGERRNKNGRIYPVHVLDEAVAEYNRDYISRRRAFGELDHPESVSVNLKNASHIIESLTRVGNDYVGRAKILDNDMGRIVKSFMDEGCQLSVSSRGLGAMNETKQGKIIQKFIIKTAADIVSDPSGHACFVNNLMEETEFIQTFDGQWVPMFVENAQKVIEKVSINTADKAAKEEAYLKVFENFCANLKA